VIWHQEAAAVRWWLSDLLRAEFIRLRRGQVTPPPAPWPNGFHFIDDLGADSIELVDLAAVLFDHTHAEQSGLLNAQRLDAQFGTWLKLAQDCLARGCDDVVFYSSGSTGEPKRITHTSAALQREVSAFAAQLTPRPDRVLSAVATHHIYGFLFGILLPQQWGCERRNVMALAPQAALLQTLPGDVIVAHPSWWDLALRGAFSIAAPVIGLSSTERCDEALFTRAKSRGMARLIDIYGSSETAGIGWRDAAGNYQLMAHLETLPANAPDQLQQHGARRFSLGQRRDRVVQVAGSKVALDQVEATLLQFAGVQTASATLSTSKPARIAAVISGASLHDDAATRSALEAHLRAQLPTAALPREIVIQRLPPATV
jgi:long-chain acyl-CoA synthetase